jgi:Rrf2 family iron-sulfur cluster assembly transcriptional regulator
VRLSHKVDYGIRVMCARAEIAAEGDARPTSSGALAETKDIPPGFLDDILRILRNGGLVRSVRGSEGGWMLARSADAITVADIIKAIGEHVKMTRCSTKEGCVKVSSKCKTHHLWRGLENKIYEYLDSVPLSSL